MRYWQMLSDWEAKERELFGALDRSTSVDPQPQSDFEFKVLELTRIREALRALAKQAIATAPHSLPAQNLVAAIEQAEQDFDENGGIDATNIDLLSRMMKAMPE